MNLEDLDLTPRGRGDLFVPGDVSAVAPAKEDAGVPGVFLGAPSRINAAGYCVTLLVMQ